jgi:RNA polymerase sigma factor (sigma-70 family)
MAEPILKRIAHGDARAVSECIDEFGGLVWSIARHFTRTRTDAEDAVQEIFTDIWRSAGRFDAAQGSEKAFVTTIARRRLIDRLRRGAQDPINDSTDVLDNLAWADPGSRAEICVEAEQAARAVAQLRPEQQRVLQLGILQGLTHAEIAATTGMPLGTVKTNMRRGLIQVRERMNVLVDERGEAQS